MGVKQILEYTCDITGKKIQKTDANRTQLRGLRVEIIGADVNQREFSVLETLVSADDVSDDVIAKTRALFDKLQGKKKEKKPRKERKARAAKAAPEAKAETAPAEGATADAAAPRKRGRPRKNPEAAPATTSAPVSDAAPAGNTPASEAVAETSFETVVSDAGVTSAVAAEGHPF